MLLSFQLFSERSQTFHDVLVHSRDADAQFFCRILIRHAFTIAQSDNGSGLISQVVVDAIHRCLPSFFQAVRLFLRQFLFRERKKQLKPFIPFLLGYNIDLNSATL